MRRLSFIAVVAIIAAVGIFFSLSGASYADKIVQGVKVGPVTLGGLSHNQAREELASLDSLIRKIPVKLKQGERAWQVEAGLLGVSLDSDSTLEKALQVGHRGSFFAQWQEQHRVKNSGLVLKPVIKVDRPTLEKKVAAEVADLIIEPQNAGFMITEDDQVKTVPGRMGQNIDFVLLSKDLAAALTLAQAPAELELHLVSTPPQRSLEDIQAMGINGKISAYSTKFDASQAGRTYNIKVAAAALNGQLIAPGEEFSFNRVVGPRSSEAGYKNANVIINNELVPGLGGGVCQVSSTLYNAVLLANLKVTDRSNHSLPIGYVPIGRDATVSYGAIDFRFVNNSQSYIYLKTIVYGNNLTIKLFGNREKTPKVEVNSWVKDKIEPKIIYEKDPNLASGEQVVKQKGSQGFIAVAERTVWRDGQKITERLPESHYQAVNKIIAIGTGEVRPSVVVPTDDELAPVKTEKTGAAAPVNTLPGDNEAADKKQQGDSPAEPEIGRPDSQSQEVPAGNQNINSTPESQQEPQISPGEEIEPETETEL